MGRGDPPALVSLLPLVLLVLVVWFVRRKAGGRLIAGSITKSAPADVGPSTSTVGKRSAYPSEFFPDFPVRLLNSAPAGCALEGEYLGSIGAVGLAFCRELQAAKNGMKWGWPQYADGECAALERVCTKMQRKAGGHHDLDVGVVRELARQYLERLKGNKEIHSRFMDAKCTASAMLVDFGNTIGYGGALHRALDFSEKTNWLDL